MRIKISTASLLTLLFAHSLHTSLHATPVPTAERQFNDDIDAAETPDFTAEPSDNTPALFTSIPFQISDNETRPEDAFVSLSGSLENGPQPSTEQPDLTVESPEPPDGVVSSDSDKGPSTEADVPITLDDTIGTTQNGNETQSGIEDRSGTEKQTVAVVQGAINGTNTSEGQTSTEEPSRTEEPTSTEEPTRTDEPTSTEEPALSAELIDNEEPTGTTKETETVAQTVIEPPVTLSVLGTGEVEGSMFASSDPGIDVEESPAVENEDGQIVEIPRSPGDSFSSELVNDAFFGVVQASPSPGPVDIMGSALLFEESPEPTADAIKADVGQDSASLQEATLTGTINDANTATILGSILPAATIPPSPLPNLFADENDVVPSAEGDEAFDIEEFFTESPRAPTAGGTTTDLGTETNIHNEPAISPESMSSFDIDSFLLEPSPELSPGRELSFTDDLEALPENNNESGLISDTAVDARLTLEIQSESSDILTSDVDGEIRRFAADATNSSENSWQLIDISEDLGAVLRQGTSGSTRFAIYQGTLPKQVAKKSISDLEQSIEEGKLDSFLEEQGDVTNITVRLAADTIFNSGADTEKATSGQEADDELSNSGSASTNSEGSKDNSKSESPKKSGGEKLPIILGSLFGTVALALAALGALVFMRKQRRDPDHLIDGVPRAPSTVTSIASSETGTSRYQTGAPVRPRGPQVLRNQSRILDWQMEHAEAAAKASHELGGPSSNEVSHATTEDKMTVDSADVKKGSFSIDDLA